MRVQLHAYQNDHDDGRIADAGVFIQPGNGMQKFLLRNSGFVGPPTRPVTVSDMSKMLPSHLAPPVLKLNPAVLLHIGVFLLGMPDLPPEEIQEGESKWSGKKGRPWKRKQRGQEYCCKVSFFDQMPTMFVGWNVEQGKRFAFFSKSKKQIS